MGTLREAGDTIEGEKIICVCRKVDGPYLIAGTSAHRANKVVMHGLPAVAWVEKPVRL